MQIIIIFVLSRPDQSLFLSQSKQFDLQMAEFKTDRTIIWNPTALCDSSKTDIAVY